MLKTGCCSCCYVGQWEHGESQSSQEAGARQPAYTVSLYVYEDKNALGDRQKSRTGNMACQVKSRSLVGRITCLTAPSHPG